MRSRTIAVNARPRSSRLFTSKNWIRSSRACPAASYSRRPTVVAGLCSTATRDEPGQRLLEELELLGADLRGELLAEPGDVASGPGQAGDQTRLHGISGVDHDDRDRRRRPLGGERRRLGGGDDHVHLVAARGRRPSRRSARGGLRPSGTRSRRPCPRRDPALAGRRRTPRRCVQRPPGSWSSTPRRGESSMASGHRRPQGDSTAAPANPLMKARRPIIGTPGGPLLDDLVRPEQAATAGSSSPSALAVFRLIASSNFVGCSTGRSPGLAPLRILSTYTAARRKFSVIRGP